MAISLFAHNQTAYENVMAMLEQTKKAAVIHPTGTGKSFIGFKLCEEHPEKKICWLSPSEYIFQTQVENLKKTGAQEPQNIVFYTYAKLMLMGEEQLREIQPDYIVLDEFHRCGAEMWGQGVLRLLRMYPGKPMLGLSATNIRYLDSQRDMAQELFEGNIASEMSLGEAIVSGILNPPRYVLSMYAYQKELKKQELRIRAAKSKAVRDAAGEYFEALRRALENAEGLDQIFERHITEKDGKYIVFCANVEHMRDMIQKVPEWFHRVDTHPHIYSVYSDFPETDREFLSFREDASSHLKLLFCIDMLNEGIHVEDVSGVILLRPTVSPIIYKQQIGRALSASKKKNAVIFDIVLNIENLYSIGTIEEEMKIAAAYYRSHGMSGRIVNEHFQVIDEVKNCVALFRKLNETLGASWGLIYQAAKHYYEEHGNLNVPKRYVTPEGFSLGAWLGTQRRVYEGKTGGILTVEQIERLNAIGMRWQSASDENWERNFAAARKYYSENGNLLVPAENEKYEGVALGRWLSNLRTCRKSSIRSAYLTPERIKALERIGMVWDVPDYLWEQNYNAAMQYHRKHGNLNVRNDYIDENGVRLGAWIVKLRRIRKGEGAYQGAKLTEEQIARLDELGMIWESRQDAAWRRSYEAVCRYKAEHGNLNIPVSYISEDGQRIGRWIRHQRENYGTKLARERRQLLDDIGMM